MRLWPRRQRPLPEASIRISGNSVSVVGQQIKGDLNVSSVNGRTTINGQLVTHPGEQVYCGSNSEVLIAGQGAKIVCEHGSTKVYPTCSEAWAEFDSNHGAES